jgi:hypothetical protein
LFTADRNLHVGARPRLIAPHCANHHRQMPALGLNCSQLLHRCYQLLLSLNRRPLHGWVSCSTVRPLQLSSDQQWFFGLPSPLALRADAWTLLSGPAKLNTSPPGCLLGEVTRAARKTIYSPQPTCAAFEMVSCLCFRTGTTADQAQCSVHYTD